MSRWRSVLGRRAELAVFAARRLGTTGGVGALLVVVALGARTGFGLAADRKAEQMRIEAAQLRGRLTQPDEVSTPADRLAAFYDALALPESLSPGGGIEPPVVTVHRLARRHHLSIERGDYQTFADPSGRFVRHQMNIPMQATYPEFTAWLSEVMKALPGAALEGLSLKREAAGEAELAVEARLVVFVKAPAPLRPIASARDLPSEGEARGEPRGSR